MKLRDSDKGLYFVKLLTPFRNFGVAMQEWRSVIWII